MGHLLATRFRRSLRRPSFEVDCPIIRLGQKLPVDRHDLTLITAADDFPCPNRLHSKRILPERRRRDSGRLDSTERGEGGDIMCRGRLRIQHAGCLAANERARSRSE